MALKKIVLTKLKTVEFTPMPTDNERRATRVKPGFLSSMRIPNRTSFRKDSISTSIVIITGYSVTLDRVEAGPTKRGFLRQALFTAPSFYLKPPPVGQAILRSVALQRRPRIRPAWAAQTECAGRCRD